MKQSQRVETVDFVEGINVSRSNISNKFSLTEESKNITMGDFDGIGPRYGITAISYQNLPTTVDNFYREPQSLFQSENDYTDFMLSFRQRRVFGILKFNMGAFDNYQKKDEYPAFIVQNTETDVNGVRTARLMISFPGVRRRRDYESNVFSGSNQFAIFHDKKPFLDYPLDYDRKQSYNLSISTNADSIRDLPVELTRVNFVNISVPDKSFPCEYILYSNIRSLDPSNELNPLLLGIGSRGEFKELYDLPKVTGNQPISGWSFRVPTGEPYLAARLRFYKENENIQKTSYKLSESIDTNVVNYEINLSSSIDFTYTGTFSGQSTLYVLKNKNNTFSSKYNFIGIAAQSPLIGILRDYRKTVSYTQSSTRANEIPISMIDWISVDKPAIFSRATTFYKENGINVSTCFQNFPPFTTGTPLPKNSVTPVAGLNDHLSLGDANTGVLRLNTVYEISFSYFDRSLNYETNVGAGAKFQTGSDDFVKLSIYRRYIISSLNIAPINNNIIDISFNQPPISEINFKTIRFYYRQVGTYEWLPTLEIEAVDFFFNPDRDILWVCENPVALLPGGQPGGFVDYSPLPKSDYHTVLSYENRCFWLSRSLLAFSLVNNPLAYPIRNQAVCPRGTFVGAITHAYPGQAVQDARLVIFGSEETYQARFIQNAEDEQFVRVGPFDGGTFPVEGTNFRIAAWTNATAFSDRAAVVAEGVLYFWGNQGVYLDDGRDLPIKISEFLEPWISELVEDLEKQNVLSIFNDQTREVIWFYKPRSPNQNNISSHALVLNVRTKAFYRWTFKNIIIDNVQKTNCRFDKPQNSALNGQRIVLYARETTNSTPIHDQVQRVLFLDSNMYACDHAPSMYFFASVVSTPTTSTMTFTFPNQSVSTKLTVNTDVLTVAGSARHANLPESSSIDGKYAITLISGDVVTVVRPSGFTLPGGYSNTTNTKLWIPCFFNGGVNDIDVLIKSNFWAFGGLYRWWLYLYSHMLFKIKLLPVSGTNNNISISYQGIIDNGSPIINVISLFDNARGNCQIHNAISPLQNQVSSQGIQTVIAVTHMGGLWSLQYLGYDCVPEEVDQSRFFEG